MKMNMDALKALELKLAEYSEKNGTIATHNSANMNICQCTGLGCGTQCSGACSGSCSGGCSGGSSGRY